MRTLSLLLILLPQFLIAQKEMTIKAEVAEVTVYRQGALIQREVEKEFTKGNYLLRFNDLLPDIDLNSVRFRSEGDLRVLNIHRKIVTDTVEVIGPEQLPDREEIEKQIERIRLEQSRERKLLEVYSKEESFLQENLNLKTEKEAVNLDNLMRATDYARERYLNIRKMQAEIEDRITEMDKEVADLSAKLLQNRTYRTQQHAEVEVRLRSNSAHKSKFILSYFYQAAGWFPAYEARVNSVEDDLQLIHFAKVYQRSDEDWKNIKLVITNSTPKLNQTLPDLAPQYIQTGNMNSDQRRGQAGIAKLNTQLTRLSYNPNIRRVMGRVTDKYGSPLPFVTVQINGQNSGTTTDVNGQFSLDVPQGARQIQFSHIGMKPLYFQIGSSVMDVIMEGDGNQLSEVSVSSIKSATSMEVQVISGGVPGNYSDLPRQKKKEKAEVLEVEVSYTPTQVRFELDGKHDIPRGGDKYDIAIHDIELASEYCYEAVPAKDPAAYLTARVSGWEQYNLLSGPVNIYLEKNYVGMANLNLAYASDTLAFSLGRDEGIKVQRQTIRNGHARKFIASKRHLERKYRFEIRNNKRNALQLIVYDQVPVSYAEDVEVKLGDEAEESLLDETKGLLRWEFPLDSGESREFFYDYSIIYPEHIFLNAGI